MARHERHGLLFLSGLEPGHGGMNRSILQSRGALEQEGVYLYPFVARGYSQLAKSLARRFLTQRPPRIDFVFINSVAAFHQWNRFGYAAIQRAIRRDVPVYMYWHESKWVFDALAKERPRDFDRCCAMATHPRIRHLVASDACGADVRNCLGAAKTQTIYECAEVAMTDASAPIPEDPPLIVNVASLQARKGPDLFVDVAIKVCEAHPIATFQWLGREVQPIDAERTRIQEAGLGTRITFPGFQTNPHETLARASALFLSSRDDPLPLSLLEAMALSRSVVAFRVGGAPEALGESGMLIAPFDTDAAAQALLEILKRPAGERLSMALRKRYAATFTPEKFAARSSAIILNGVG